MTEKLDLAENPAVAEGPGAGEIPAQVSEWKRFRRVFLQRKLVLFGLVVLGIVVLAAIFAPLLAPHKPYQNNLAVTLQQPSWTYPLGTDAMGRDILSRLIYGARTALLVGLATVGISSIFGIILGLLAGYFGGLIDGIIMRCMDALMGFPLLLLALLLASVLGGGIQNVILALSIATIPGYTRLMRSMTLSVKENDYIMAQRALGAGSVRTMFRHILPNAIHPMIVLVTTMLGNVILAEAALSFLGIGIRPPGVAWGSMTADGYRYMETNPMLSIAPGFAIMMVVFAFNLVGDGLRDALDPRLRGTL